MPRFAVRRFVRKLFTARRRALQKSGLLACTAGALLCGLLAWTTLVAQERGGKRPARPVKPVKAELPPAAVFSRFPDWVACAAFSPDGRTLAAGSYGVVKLIDPLEKSETGPLQEPAGFVKSLAFSPDGRTLVTGSYQVVALWDVAERKRVKTLKGHRGYVTAVTFSPDGGTLATASDDETVRLRDAATGEVRLTLSGITQPALALAYSRDGRLIAVATGDATRPAKKGATHVFDADGNLLFTLGGHDRTISAVAFSPDGSILATASADETIRLWNATDGSELRTLEGHTRPVNSLVFLPDGKWLVSVSGGRNKGGNEIKLWEVESGKERVSVAGHDSPIQNVALSADGKLLATSSLDKTVRLWEVAGLLGSAGAAKPAPAGKPAESEPRPEPVPLPEDATGFALAMTGLAAADPPAQADKPVLRGGIIGLDTSHSVAFTQLLNDPNRPDHVPGCRVVVAFPQGSKDIRSSTERVPDYTAKMKDLGVEVVDTIEALVDKVDVVFLESNDGRPHLEQVLPVLKGGKPVFIDKPIAGSLADAIAIFELAKKYKVPVFSSSSLRYTDGAQAIRGGKLGEVKGCDAYSPCALEATHPDLFWYGIHGVETLFTVMGTGCESVTRVSTPGIDLAAGVWKGGRVGTFRGIRTEAGGGQASYGGTAFGTKGIEPIGNYQGYRPLVVEIIKFFQTGKVPVTEEETLEIYAFMEAADESKRQEGKPVTIESVMSRAREAAKARIAP